MRTQSQILAAVFSLLTLSACDKGPVPLDAASDKPASAAPGFRLPSTVDTSVPPADSVAMPSAAPAGPAAAVGRSNSAMTAREQSGAMPLPGQNNDHSAPATSTKAPAKP
ncbi:MAG: hypothetical protein Q8R72_10295 [Hylemonella sp.]|nr:hypothetical protein [Hylemonella sp.]